MVKFHDSQDAYESYEGSIAYTDPARQLSDLALQGETCHLRWVHLYHLPATMVTAAAAVAAAGDGISADAAAAATAATRARGVCGGGGDCGVVMTTDSTPCRADTGVVQEDPLTPSSLPLVNSELRYRTGRSLQKNTKTECQ